MPQPPIWNRHAMDNGDAQSAPGKLTDLAAVHYQHLYRHAPVIMALLNDQGEMLSVTQHWLEVFGCRREEVIGHSIGEFMTASSRHKADEQIRPRFLKSGRVDDVRYRFVSRAGGTFDGELSARRTTDAKGRKLTLAVIFDVTATRRARRDLQAANERLTTTLNSIGEGVLSTDVDNHVRYLNPAALRLLGTSIEDAVGRPLSTVYQRLGPAQALGTDVAAAAPPGEQGQLEAESPGRSSTVVLATSGGHLLTVEETVTPMRDGAGRVDGAVLVFRDVTAQRQLQQRISFQARHDALTGLFNRYEFEHRVREAIDSARSPGAEHALLYLDLDRFKHVNDSAGHAAGDGLLQQLSVQLQGALRQGDTLARLGGDEFGVLLQNCSPRQALGLGDRLRECVREFRYYVGTQTFTVGASIGLVSICGQATDVAAVLRQADEACYAAKRDGRNRVRIHPTVRPSTPAGDSPASTASVTPSLLVQRLHPLRQLGHGQHLALLSTPSTTDPVSGDLERIHELQRTLLQLTPALEDIATLSIPLMGAHLGDAKLVSAVRDLLSDGALLPQQLYLEIPEHAALRDLQSARDLVNKLARQGIRFALRNTYDSLRDPQLLRKLPVDFLALDPRLVTGLREDVLFRPAVGAISKMAQALGVFTVAPGVDDSSTIELLEALSIDFARGEAIAPPFPLGEASCGGAGAMLQSQTVGE